MTSVCVVMGLIHVFETTLGYQKVVFKRFHILYQEILTDT